MEAHSENIAHFCEMVLGMLIWTGELEFEGFNFELEPGVFGVREWHADFPHFSTLLPESYLSFLTNAA